MRRLGSRGSSRSRRKTITGGVNTAGSTGEDLFMSGVGTGETVVMAGTVDIPGTLEMATRDRTMRRERLTHSQQGLDLFCRARIYRDTRKISPKN